jgi:predicted nuclease of predicted toxin-antitoxin system
MKIVADESVDFRIISYLRRNSIDVVAIIENRPSISDIEVLKKANEKIALLITEDKDFGELVFRLKIQHKGILLLRFFDTDIEIQSQKVLEVLLSHEKELIDNFSTLTENKLRIRQTDL